MVRMFTTITIKDLRKVTDNTILFFIACYKPYLFDYKLKVK